MKRASFTTLLFLALAGIALAAAHFQTATEATVNSSGSLIISFDEAGLGNGNIDYTAVAGAQAVYGCINGGGKHPQATNKETVNATVSGGGTFQAKNGRVQASLTLAVPQPPSDFSCPSGQTQVLASVTYTDALLTDTTNSVSVSQADMSGTFSRTFVTFR